ncbi:MAG: transcription-repair coupling factor, partial [Rhodospirillaceae bacterium]
MEPLIVLELAEKNPEAIVVFVTLDDAAISEAVEAISYFSPGINILTLPAWDCVPYDRVSPRSDILGKRVAALSTLSMAKVTDPTVLVTSNNAFLQRVPNRELFYKNSLKISTGSEISVDTLSKFLETNGFNRTGTVREAGEYAFRGGIIDIFPANSDNPVRFDLFGDEIEEIRGFDALTQQSIETKDHVVLTPVSELFLDQSSISRFRTGYRSLFGNVSDDPLYESIS